MLNLIALLAACSSPATPEPNAAGDEAPPATTEEAPPTEAAPETDAAPAGAEATMHIPEPGHAGIIELLGSAGACKASGVEKPSMAMEWTYKGQQVYATECESYAYQSDFEWWVQTPEKLVPITDASGNPKRFLGYPSFDPATGEASWLSKARGIGDCGDWQSYTLSGTTLTLKEHRSRECDDNNVEGAGPASQWPLQPSASGPANAAALEAAIQGTVEVITNELSGEDVGKNITRASDGDLFGVPCTAMISVYTDTWGCETTETFTLDGYTTKVGWVALHYGTGKRAGVVFSDLVPASEGADVQGVACKEYAHFHPNGKLAGCMLSAPAPFGKVKPPAGTDVRLREDGSLESAVVYTSFSVGDTKVPEGTIEFDAAGNITQANEGWFGE